MTEVRKFGLLFGAIGIAVTIYLAWTGNQYWPWAIGFAGFFVLSGLFAPGVLRPVYVAWMRLAFVLGWINTRILLSLFFYLVMTPIGLLLRMMGKDLLDERIDREAHSYWVRRDAPPFDPEQYRRLF